MATATNIERAKSDYLAAVKEMEALKEKKRGTNDDAVVEAYFEACETVGEKQKALQSLGVEYNTVKNEFVTCKS